MDTEHAGLAEALTLRRPDRFGGLRDHVQRHIGAHGCDGAPLGTVEARELAVVARATHASYVLELGAGLGESTLHLASAFGQTGRIDAVEADDAHATFIEQMAKLFALDAAVRVQRAPAERVIAALSGPYDLVVVHGLVGEELTDDIVRLVRTGGSILVLPAPGQATIAAVPVGGGLLDRLATDPRLLAWFAPGMGRVLANRVR
ncbi:MAG: class I SAM-dependent methyltransferase [Dehalococcoidia bacterium]|nr:class I SAM-dependent methyltransferase [Dehalococcoidia bacterium]